MYLMGFIKFPCGNRDGNESQGCCNVKTWIGLQPEMKGDKI